MMARLMARRMAPASMRRRAPSLFLLAPLVALFLAGCERPPMQSEQRGFRGTAMGETKNPRAVAAQKAANQAPEIDAPAPADGPKASTAFKNVQVLGDVSVAEFTRTMVAITRWVSPEQNCAYCHKPGEDMSSDSMYTKVVARKMLQMTRRINDEWRVSHVSNTGVTCYTCHRGQPVPSEIWFTDLGPPKASAFMGDKAGQNTASMVAKLASLPVDPFTPFLLEAKPIRVSGKTALPEGNHSSIKQAEWTFSLMTHMSGALGVNCTYCHNTRSFDSWEDSPPQRATAWHGIRMVREINNEYMSPLAKVFPNERLGAGGDVPKANCATCHAGAYKPLLGVSMAKDYPALYTKPFGPPK
jgi:photosynthetic reaction center cytochrome c subunit